MKKCLLILLVFISLCSFSYEVQAEDYSYLTSSASTIYEVSGLDANGNTTITWNKGKWWYSTSAYKKDMKKLYQSF